MDILVIGNGFDLAHDLPTKYTDFLEFARIMKDILSGTQIGRVNWRNVNPEIKRLISDNVQNTSGNIYSDAQEWLDLIKDNLWIEYFQQIQAKENWIDFESEISAVIQSLDNDMINKDGKRVLLKEDIGLLSNLYLQGVYSSYISLVTSLNTSASHPSISYEKVRDRLLDDLHKLIRALELYLILFVEKIPINIYSPEIANREFHRIINFNYSHSYTNNNSYRMPNKAIEFIHGEANVSNSIESNDMVLGIDEYLPRERQNQEIDFIGFKKYFQRINKGTGCEYKDMIVNINKFPYGGQTGKHNNLLYIFGHSLDITDKDIIGSLITAKDVFTTVFYLNPKVKAQQIANLARVLGPDELIKRTGGPTKSIMFVQQSPMIQK